MVASGGDDAMDRVTLKIHLARQPVVTLRLRQKMKRQEVRRLVCGRGAQLTIWRDKPLDLLIF